MRYRAPDPAFWPKPDPHVSSILVSEVIITVASNPDTDEQSVETGDHSQDIDMLDKGRIIVVIRRFLSVIDLLLTLNLYIYLPNDNLF